VSLGSGLAAVSYLLREVLQPHWLLSLVVVHRLEGCLRSLEPVDLAVPGTEDWRQPKRKLLRWGPHWSFLGRITVSVVKTW